MFLIAYIKDGKSFSHHYKPNSLEEAMGVGHELTRDFVADYFKVIRL